VRQPWVGLASGVVFALGLALSGMTDPGKVLSFLDVTGAWDPTLALVMGGAVGTHALWLRFTRGRSLAAPPPSRGVDGRLVLGAALFGVGWGLSGYCPGPALVTAAFGRREALVLLLGIVAGTIVYRLWDRRAEPAARPLAANN